MQSMLEHQIVVLDNVSDSTRLFRKEMEKSLKWLDENELAELKQWLLSKYQYKYYELIHEMFDVVIL